MLELAFQIFFFADFILTAGFYNNILWRWPILSYHAYFTCVNISDIPWISNIFFFFKLFCHFCIPLVSQHYESHIFFWEQINMYTCNIYFFRFNIWFLVFTILTDFVCLCTIYMYDQIEQFLKQRLYNGIHKYQWYEYDFLF